MMKKVAHTKLTDVMGKILAVSRWITTMDSLPENMNKYNFVHFKYAQINFMDVDVYFQRSKYCWLSIDNRFSLKI